ncbi:MULTISPECIES: type III secretion system inner membrane ring lipoprotein SctJ [Pantoea]|uniref:Lipoprotein n=4 Tax=Pantoea stewartii TaxID=66269 RepID=A0ABN4ZAY5_PANSE|nr:MULTISPECIES: type III secretion inner membrane ring lipoprotein SctJ [Pantoea]AAG01458.1 HrcJ [Pantoea stewartii subsp. stewartii]ARF52494.1 EscJ/YscJ/HrcJ family type III secretion inner membrane ring protein [Pantoea stewartii subsp. stewartii DC283]KAB0552741.1 EscJ/YscJ/HrcJ family type III secretion inner membrane ring protein [Pantoea stewartii subsp. stewartii]KGD80080.1 type III secretion protein [Pantoea stewartii subsp. indologenes]KHE01072.1 type III secretion protein [Pantoea s
MVKFPLKSLILMSVLLLFGCNDQVELNHGLTENDANEVAAELGRYHIKAEKHTNKDGITVMVDTADLNRAVHILDAAGLPRPTRTNLGEVFQKNGVISTPLEERARYIYALSQEVESTLSQIDGVIVARVHVVLPERVAPGEPILPASAAVFIKYRPELDPDVIEPRIRQMVASSLPGLAGRPGKDLAIVFVPAGTYQDKPSEVSFGPFTVTPQRATQLTWLSGTIGTLILLAVAASVGLPYWRRYHQRKKTESDEKGE